MELVTLDLTEHFKSSRFKPKQKISSIQNKNGFWPILGFLFPKSVRLNFVDLRYFKLRIIYR